MPKFFYIVRDAEGKKIQNYEEAATQDELVSRLQARNYIIVTLSAETKENKAGLKQEVVAKAGFKPRHYGANTHDLAMFCRQLATLLGAGVTILKSLEIISKQVSSRKLLDVTKELQKDMESGLSLHESMAKHPKVFSDLWVNLVESGEASGNLAVVLNRLASYLERSETFKSKIISALIYPLILFTAGLGALLFLTLKIIPVFADLFKGFNVKLPALTQMLVNLSHVIRSTFVLIIAVLIGGFFALRQFIRTKNGRLQFERFLFSLPVFGDFFRALIVERFSSEMSTLIESGVPILYSLEITEQSVNNMIVANIIREVKEEVRSGKTLSQPLDRSGFFEPMVIQMITIGEEIGELSQMFKKINSFYQEVIETFLTRFTSMFEPIMLLFIGSVIGIMVVGLFLPIFQIAQIGG
ncbi:MAG: type II secretion system F family protein [Candidatus Omnitrophica bacterium]|nr:type II secretion system F family protein [Candidatus Omnitrophota bacterium]